MAKYCSRDVFFEGFDTPEASGTQDTKLVSKDVFFQGLNLTRRKPSGTQNTKVVFWDVFFRMVFGPPEASEQAGEQANESYVRLTMETAAIPTVQCVLDAP